MAYTDIPALVATDRVTLEIINALIENMRVLNARSTGGTLTGIAANQVLTGDGTNLVGFTIPDNALLLGTATGLTTFAPSGNGNLYWNGTAFEIKSDNAINFQPGVIVG